MIATIHRITSFVGFFSVAMLASKPYSEFVSSTRIPTLCRTLALSAKAPVSKDFQPSACNSPLPEAARIDPYSTNVQKLARPLFLSP
jgi:hypothetical protein